MNGQTKSYKCDKKLKQLKEKKSLSLSFSPSFLCLFVLNMREMKEKSNVSIWFICQRHNSCNRNSLFFHFGYPQISFLSILPFFLDAFWIPFEEFKKFRGIFSSTLTGPEGGEKMKINSLNLFINSKFWIFTWSGRWRRNLPLLYRNIIVTECDIVKFFFRIFVSFLWFSIVLFLFCCWFCWNVMTKLLFNAFFCILLPVSVSLIWSLCALCSFIPLPIVFDTIFFFLFALCCSETIVGRFLDDINTRTILKVKQWKSKTRKKSDNEVNQRNVFVVGFHFFSFFPFIWLFWSRVQVVIKFEQFFLSFDHFPWFYFVFAIIANFLNTFSRQVRCFFNFHFEFHFNFQFCVLVSSAKISW